MRKIQKILAGIFLTGVLVGGVGTGIAVVEYSSLAYGGEKVIGEDSLVTETLDFNFELDGRMLEIVGTHYWGDGDIREITIDNTVPAGTVRFEVTYNEKTVTPSLEFEAYTEEDMDMETEEEMEWEDWQEEEMGNIQEEQAEAAAEREVVDEEEYMEDVQTGEEEDVRVALESEATTGEESGNEGEKKAGKLGYLRLVTAYHSDDFRIWMENKDQVLEDLKQRKLSSYDVAYITDIKIKVNQETVPYIDSYYTIR